MKKMKNLTVFLLQVEHKLHQPSKQLLKMLLFVKCERGGKRKEKKKETHEDVLLVSVPNTFSQVSHMFLDMSLEYPCAVVVCLFVLSV